MNVLYSYLYCTIVYIDYSLMFFSLIEPLFSWEHEAVIDSPYVGKFQL